MSRYTYARAILGDELCDKLQETRILMVGAGGIGCELLKNIALSGFGYIHVIDLDTIDLSNLNRQFLFQKQHVKKSKALVAKETALQFNPHVDIYAECSNIKEARYDVKFFKSFDIVLNALDNMDARRHVNKMCMAANVPLVESGTAGYTGQVQPIQRGRVECYDCSGKPVPKGFPVCTIRSTPSTPIHCIVWAKSYLFPQLFGISEDDQELDKAAADGENAQELNELRKEAADIQKVRQELGQSPASYQRVFEKVFKKDIERLLSMEDMWKYRAKPTPLNFDDLSSHTNGVQSGSTLSDSIKDQRELGLHGSFQLFMDSIERLAQRVKKHPETPLDWDKDDDDALDFATAAANLRAHIFSIPLKTRFDVKQMAGNIIPAIATTNAIVAGLIVLQALKVLRDRWAQARMVWVARSHDRAITNTILSQPNQQCAVCSTPYVHLAVNASKFTVQAFLADVTKAKFPFEGDVSLVEGNRVLYDPDFDDNAEKTFEQLGLSSGTMLTVNDEEGDLSSVVFVISALTEGDKSFEIGDPIPEIPSKPKSAEVAEEVSDDGVPAISIVGKKRSADEAELDIARDELKRAKIDASGIVIIDDEDEIQSHIIEID